VSLKAAIALVRRIAPAIPALAGTAAGRTALLAQLSARPWALDPALVTRELTDLAAHGAAADATLAALIQGPTQAGGPGEGVTIVWGRQDRLTTPSQAHTAQARFPGSRLEWLDRCGHLPHWDRPQETARLVLAATG
jgi:pimeloyl-ACP methyl ester carboxylesterase